MSAGDARARAPKPDGGAQTSDLPAQTEIVVVGAGILGSLTALHCARRGLSVLLIEREPALWTRASLHNEGKVHLGHVYALGSAATRRALLADALAFSAEVERALDDRVDWSAIRTPPFSYIVMPDSQLAPEGLAARYRAIDDAHHDLGRPSYLGETLETLAAVTPSVDEHSGFPCFTTAERAVDPIALRAIIVDRLERDPGVEIALNADVMQIAESGGGATVEVEAGGSRGIVAARAVIDCRWENQGADIAGRNREPRNIRVKAAVRLRVDEPVPTATLVAGPYGDLVQHRDYAYVSWYPAARLHHEFSTRPSPSAEVALRSAAQPSVIQRQLRALRDFGWLRGDVEVLDGVGGFILGAGALDIADPRSMLHDRDASGVERYGAIYLPRSLKFSSAPAAASSTAEAVWRKVRGA